MDFLKKLQSSLDEGKIDESVSEKIKEMTNIIELADIKVENDDTSELYIMNDTLKNKINSGYFIEKITEDDLKKSEEENKIFEQKLEKENKKNKILADLFDLELDIDKAIDTLKTYISEKINPEFKIELKETILNIYKKYENI